MVARAVRLAGERTRWSWSIVGPLAVLAIALLGVAFGSVSIPPLTVLQLLLAQLPFAHITAGWPATY